MMFCFWSVVRAQTGGECIDFQYNQYNRVEERKRERKGREKHCSLKWKSWQPLCHIDIPTNAENLFLSRFTQTIMRSLHTQVEISQRGVFSTEWFQLFWRKTKKIKAKRERGTKFGSHKCRWQWNSRKVSLLASAKPWEQKHEHPSGCRWMELPLGS